MRYRSGMKRTLALLMLGYLPSAPGAERGVWLCIGAPELTAAAAPLCELRAAQGWTVVRSQEEPAAAIAAHRPAAVLLLGDDSHAADAGFSGFLPARRLPYHGWKSSHPEHFISDAAFGDTNGDGMPDLPVGRIPARGAAEAAAVVEKIIAWEKRVPSPADLSVPVWAGDPGFGRIGEAMTRVALPFLMRRLRSESPPWAGFWLLHSEPRSPFCGWPHDSATTFNRRIGGGALLSAMIGHGRTDSWWIMTLPDTTLRYAAADARAMSQGPPSPPHVLFACQCGDFADPRRRSLAEELLFAPGGPVACIAASVDSHPLPNYYGSTALLRHLAGNPAATFGEAWLESMRLAHGRREILKEWLVGVLEPLVIGTRNRVADLKADHLLIYNLMGDPATRLFLPQPLSAEVGREGDAWRWTVAKPAGMPAGARLLVQHRAPLPDFRLEPPRADPAAATAALHRANAALDFRTLHELDADAVWTGTIADPGTLRLCLTGGQELRVHAAPLTAAP
jgi:hypothetical protein